MSVVAPVRPGALLLCNFFMADDISLLVGDSLILLSAGSFFGMLSMIDGSGVVSQLNTW